MTRSFCLALLIACAASAFAADLDWPVYQGVGSNQHSEASQITPANVTDLEVVWSYSSDGGDISDRAQIQCNPIVVGDTLYGTSTKFKLFALDAATGEERWVFNPFEDGYRLYGLGVNRGVTYWEDEDDRRILYTAASELFAVDAKSGKLIRSFGNEGRVSLLEGLGRDVEGMFVVSNTPGAIFEDLLILGSRVNEAHPAAPGHIRAYNVRTGAIEWIFHTIPQPGEFGYDTWPEDAYKSTGGANGWSGMTVDHERETVFVPTGSAAYDYYGGDRPGANLFANCLLALNARTGERRWHFQMVHHDIWDRDLPAPPNLITVERDGKRIDAVAQITKSAHVFVFDRDTGEPLFPIDEVPVPASDLPGEQAWPTQPIPRKPPPFSRQILTPENVSKRTPEIQAALADQISRVRSNGQFVPPSREGTIIFPGLDGGGEWGGAAYDPSTGTMIVNASEMPWLITMIPLVTDRSNVRARSGSRTYTQSCLYCHGVDKAGDPLDVYPSLIGLKERYTEETLEAIIRQGKGMMPSFDHLRRGQMRALIAYLFEEESSTEKPDASTSSSEATSFVHNGYPKFTDKDGFPGLEPPWGVLTAIDLNEGEIEWQVTLGDMEEARGPDDPPTGAENYGGPVVTAGGLVFIGATKDQKFRAFDKKDGKLLWETSLPTAGFATPSTYTVDGRQFVVIACGGGKIGVASGDQYVAFALPETR